MNMKCLIAAGVAALSVAAFAQESAAPRGPRLGGIRPGSAMGAMAGVEPVLRAVQNPKVAEKLGLSAEQITKLKALADGHDAMKDLQEKVRKGMAKQTELLQAETIDEAAVMAALDEVWEARKEVAKRQTRRLIAARSILTAEQIKTALTAMREMRGGATRRGPRTEGCGRKRGPKPEKAAPAVE